MCDVACEFGSNGKECEPSKFQHKVFGIGEQCNETEADIGGLSRYHLYPRILQENSTYLNHTVQINGGVQTIEIVLYQADKFIYSGLRVLDFGCYQQIVEIINATVPGIGHVGQQEFKVFGEIETSAGELASGRGGFVTGQVVVGKEVVV